MFLRSRRKFDSYTESRDYAVTARQISRVLSVGAGVSAVFEGTVAIDRYLYPEPEQSASLVLGLMAVDLAMSTVMYIRAEAADKRATEGWQKFNDIKAAEIAAVEKPSQPAPLPEIEQK